MISTARHIPVLLPTVLKSLGSIDGALIIDATFGAGGYSRAFLEKGAQVIGFDRDPNAIRDGAGLVSSFAPRLRLIHSPFSELDQKVKENVDAIVFDIGVSSMQIDEDARGFSFQKDGPLDMRMAQSGFSAADVINFFKQSDLTRIFGLLGEERHAGRVARMVVSRRSERPFLTTLDLSQAIANLLGRKPNDPIHPATRVFQALRIYVNDELGQLAQGLFAAERLLKPNGRLAVVTFHSLEDRMVKKFFTARAGGAAPSRYLPEIAPITPSFLPLFKGGKTADNAEVSMNPRARSARLRVGIRQNAPAHEADMRIFNLPTLPIFMKGAIK
ncbi:16S rRNA (cytosine(1402)-N(4))-methyltransferase RsmH [Bartonella sp. DGB2]|uniref:16S rRNA (cytosine(1402)-N(4))-methyltransferase RsmH n=1 Tax=Bartonella sp. DGB2 TaxID=3388426 RepID=UPI00398FC05E